MPKRRKSNYGARTIMTKTAAGPVKPAAVLVKAVSLINQQKKSDQNSAPVILMKSLQPPAVL